MIGYPHRTHEPQNHYCPCFWCSGQSLRSDHPGGARAIMSPLDVDDRAIKWNFKILVDTLLDIQSGIDWYGR